MAADDPLRNEPLVSVEFEVFGKVQGVYFPKYVRDICLQLGICGWVKNTKSGTILGKMQGPRALIDQMKIGYVTSSRDNSCAEPSNYHRSGFHTRAEWLTKVGSPGSEIHHCELTNWEGISRLNYKGFAIRF